jgi:hypothetical protein
VEIVDVSGGAGLGQALFRASINNGTSWFPTTPTVASYNIPGTNKSLTFPAGTYATNNVYQATVAALRDDAIYGGVARNATAADATREPLFTGSNASFNGRPSIDWPVGSTLPMLDTTVFTALPQPMTYVVVGVCTLAAGGTRTILARPGNTNTDQHLITILSSTGTTMRIAAGVNPTINETLDVPFVLVCRFNTTASSVHKNGSLTIGGVNIGTGNVAAFRIGRATTGSTTSGWIGSILEIAAYDHLFSVSEQKRWERYARSYYALPVAA